MCYFVIVFFSPFSIAITSLGEERAYLSVFRMFVRFARIWFCLFPFPLGVWEGLQFKIVALPGLFAYLCFHIWLFFCCHYLCIISLAIDVPRLCRVILAFPRYLHLYFH